MATNPTDYNTYCPPEQATIPSTSGIYPLWMYHPTKPAQIVPDQATQQALLASDPLWSTTDPNATS